MKKYIILAIALISVASASSCTPSSDASLPPSVETAATLSEATTEKVDPNAARIQEEVVEKATRGNVTEPSTDEETSTETEPTEAKKKKKKTSQLPTQGEVNPYLDIEVTTAPSGTLDESDFDFELDGAYIYIGDEIDDAVAIAGDDNSVTELSETEFLYEYEGLSFTTILKNNKEKVSSITVTSADYPTSKGAAVGMYATQLRKIYGESAKKSETLYTYTYGKKKLEFSVDDNIVTAIKYSK